MALGRVHQLKGEFEPSIRALGAALSLNPNFAMAHYALGYSLSDAARFEEAITEIDRARRLSPYDPFYAGFMTIRSRCLLLLDRYEEADASASRAVQCANPRFWAFAFHAAALRKLGRDSEAQASLEEALRVAPYFNVRFARAALTHLQDDAAREKEIDFYRIAGVPE